MQIITHQFPECQTHLVGCVTIHMCDVDFIVALSHDEAFSIVHRTDERWFISHDLVSIVSTFTTGIHQLYWRDKDQSKQADDVHSIHDED